MKDLIDIIAESLRDRNERESVLLLVENLYFNDVRNVKWYQSFSPSKLTLIAQDIMNLQNSIENFDSIKDVNLESELIKNKVDEISKDGTCRGIKSLPKVSDKQKEIFALTVIKPHRYYVTAVMLAELIRDEKRKIRIHQVLAYLITILTAMIGATALLLTKLWRW